MAWAMQVLSTEVTDGSHLWFALFRSSYAIYNSGSLLPSFVNLPMGERDLLRMSVAIQALALGSKSFRKLI
jgi:hypothetical protein